MLSSSDCPRVSIVCVYNDPNVLEACLLGSLRTQDQEYQWIPVDNTSGNYPSATVALNHGAREATGKYILYVHQDVNFVETSSLRQILDNVERIGPGLGWAGIAGRDGNGFWRGLLRDRDFISGEPFDNAQPVQTLDELLLCTIRDENSRFDENLHGWHAYGVDACCSALIRGKLNYVVASSVWHASKALNTAKLQESHEFIFKKYYTRLGSIMTTCGRIPKAYQWKGGYRLSSFLRGLKWRILCHRIGVRPADSGVENLGDLLDRLTIDCKRVFCVRGGYLFPEMRAVGFRDKTPVPRQVHHFFGTSDIEKRDYDASVVFPDGFPGGNRGLSNPDDFTLQVRDVSTFAACGLSTTSISRKHYMAETLDGRMFLVSSNA